MKQADFAQFLANALRNYDAPGAEAVVQADVIYEMPPSVGVLMQDGSRFLLEIEAVD